MAALQDASLRDVNFGKPADAFGNGLFPGSVQSLDEASAEVGDLREGVGLTALVRDTQRSSFLDVYDIGFEVPIAVGLSRGCLRKKIVECREGSERYVFAEVGSENGVKRGWIAFVQSDYLGNRGGDTFGDVAQVIALDECDPTTFNAILGPDFCKNVSLGSFTTFDDLFAKAAAGKPDRNWDFEPDVVHIKEGASLSVADQGGEPHTFTEVAHFGGGFVEGLNAPGEQTVPECVGSFPKLTSLRLASCRAAMLKSQVSPKANTTSSAAYIPGCV